MDSIRDLITNVTDYVNSLTTAKDEMRPVFNDWLKDQKYSDDLLSRYRLHLFQIKETNSENARLSNLASTRMSRVLQLLEEASFDVNALHTELRNIPALCDQLDAVNQQITELERFLLQTEISMECLEKAANEEALAKVH